MTNKKLKGTFKKGFTLVETLAAILVLTIALVGPMTIAQKGLSTALISKDQNSAFNMAQDAVEYLRFSRDTNCLVAATSPCPAANWLSGNGTAQTVNLTPCISTTGTSACYLDSFGLSPAAPTICTSGNCPAMNYDSSNANFTYAAIGGTVAATIFTRTIQIQYNSGCTTTCNPNEALITVTVSWNDPQPHSIQVKESLFNWQ